MIDLDKLRSALEAFDRHNPAGTRVPNASYLRIVAAARAVLDSEEVWWCEEHKATGHEDECERHVGARTMNVTWKPGYPRPCSMVRVRLLAEEKL